MSLLSGKEWRVAEAIAYGARHGSRCLEGGAFGNDAQRTASNFRSALEEEFAGAFGEVVCSITDWSHERHFLGLGPPRREHSVSGHHYHFSVDGQPILAAQDSDVIAAIRLS